MMFSELTWVVSSLDRRGNCTDSLYVPRTLRKLMGSKTSYSSARANLASIWNEVESTREPAILGRRGHEDMALIPMDDLSSLRETAHLLSSPRNAARLLSALSRSRKERTKPVRLEALIEELSGSG
jgi:antitoxin YefM